MSPTFLALAGLVLTLLALLAGLLTPTNFYKRFANSFLDAFTLKIARGLERSAKFLDPHNEHSPQGLSSSSFIQIESKASPKQIPPCILSPNTANILEVHNTLEESPHNPKTILSKPNIEYIHFMGNGASKWTEESEKLKQAILSIANNKNRKRSLWFLLYFPELCIDQNQSKTSQNKNKSQRRLKTLISLWRLNNILNQISDTHSELLTNDLHRSFVVRLYSTPKRFRICIVDNTVSVSNYKISHPGKDCPLIIMSMKGDLSFGSTFHDMFVDHWELNQKNTILFESIPEQSLGIPWRRIKIETLALIKQLYIVENNTLFSKSEYKDLDIEEVENIWKEMGSPKLQAEWFSIGKSSDNE